MLLISELRRQKHLGLCDFEASLVYTISSRTVRATLRDPVLKGRRKKEREKRVRERKKD